MVRSYRKYSYASRPTGGNGSKRRASRVASARSRGYSRSRVGYYGRYGAHSSEKKFFDDTHDFATVASAGEVDNGMLNIAAGTGESDRIGRKINVTGVNLRARFTLPAGGLAPDVVRLMLVQDKQSNGTTANVTDVLETASIWSFNNLANKNRFKIIRDKICPLNFTAGAAALEDFVHTEEWYVRLKRPMPIEYDGATGALTERRSNNLFLLAISDAGQGDVECWTRVRYADN